MPKDQEENGIVIINGTAYSVKTGLPLKEQDIQKVKSQRLSMADLSAPKPDSKEQTQNQSSDKKSLTASEKSNQKRSTGTKAKQLHMIKKGSDEQVLDLRKSARAKKLAAERKKKLISQEPEEETANSTKPLRQAGNGPKFSQSDIRARRLRARNYQKSEAIHKFFPAGQAVESNQKIDIEKDSNLPKTQNKPSNEIRSQRQLADSSNENQLQNTHEKLKSTIQTQELEKLVKKHPRYISTSKSEATQDAPSKPSSTELRNVKDEEERGKIRSFWSVFTKRPRVASYVVPGMAALILIGFVAYLSLPQMALKVAANRAGFEATMPAHRPSGFSFTGPISYAPGQIVISFGSHADDRSFELVQQKTHWDSTSLLENYVERESDNYLSVQQNGLTIYLFNSGNAAWVDGGIWYTIKGNSGLNNDQILKVAASL